MHQRLRPSGPPRAVLVFPDRIMQGAAVFPYQRASGELAEALSSGDRPDPASVFFQWRELGQGQKLDRRLREIPVRNPVADNPQVEHGLRVHPETLQVGEAQARGPGAVVEAALERAR